MRSSCTGKGIEDKRGSSVAAKIKECSWLYMNGHAVVCDRNTEVAAIVTAMNPAINANTDCEELARLQQALLWVLYDFGYLDK